MTRFTLAVLLVLVTFNPSGTSLVQWLAAPPVAITPGKVVAAVLFFAALVWLLVDRQWLRIDGSAIIWVAEIIVGILLGIGLSWSLLKAKATGQAEAV